MLFNFGDLFKSKTHSAELSYTLSDHFKGYKRFPMVVYGHKESESNNQKYELSKLPGRTISFVLSKSKDNALYYSVLIDGDKVGAIFDDEQIKSLQEDKIVSVFAKNETETIVEKERITSRNRIRLFVKYKEAKDGSHLMKTDS